MRTSLALQGADLADPQVRQAFDRSQQLPPPGPPSASPPGHESPPGGAGRAMANSAQNSAPIGNTPQPGSASLTVTTH